MNMRGLLLSAIVATVFTNFLSKGSALAASASEINRNATLALTTLYQNTPGKFDVQRLASQVFT